MVGARRAMKNAYEVLYQKEADLARVRREIESLTLAAPLLADDVLSFVYPETAPSEQNRKSPQKAVSPQPVETEPTGTDGEPFVWPRPGFWRSLTFRR
jgi:hypothetical protein